MDLDEFLKQGTTAPVQSSGSPSFDWLTGLGTSTVSALPELVGVPPLPGAAEFRMENPGFGFLSQMAGTAVPYLSWWKATKLLKPLDAAISRIGDLQKAPFATGIAQEAVRFAPFEIGRLGASQVVGSEPFTTMATDAAVSLGLNAGIGGLVHSIAAAGTRTPRFKFAPGIDTSAPRTLIARELRAKLNEGSPDFDVAGANQALQRLHEQIRLEKAPRGKYVFGTPLDKDLNTLFNTDRAQTSIQRKRFARGEGIDFKTDADWQSAAQRAGLPDNFPELGQYYRHISFTAPREAGERLKEIAQELGLGQITPEIAQQHISRVAKKSPQMAKVYDQKLSKMESIGNNWFMTKEENGLYVMAKKVKGEPGKGQITDEWLLLKTDDPGNFVPRNELWKSTVINKNSWTPGAVPIKGKSDIYDAGNKFRDLHPERDWTTIERPSALANLVSKNLKGDSNELVARLKEGFREYVAVTAHQFKKSPVARRALSTAKIVHDRALMFGDRVLYGKPVAPSAKNLYQQAVHADRRFSGDDNIKAAIDSLTDDEVKTQVWPLWKRKADPIELDALVQSGTISQNVATAVRTLQKMDDIVWDERIGLLQILDRKPPRYREGHFGLRRIWEGDSRVAIRDAAGQVVGIASGGNRRQAQSNAKRLAAALNGHIAEEFDLSQGWKELAPDVAALLRGPDYLLEARNIRGYKFDLDPFSKKELMDAYEADIRKKLNHLAAESVQDLTAQDLARVAAEDPATFRMLDQRLRDLRGEPTEWAKAQNRFVDKRLAPIIGLNGATKIVSAANKLVYSLNLGMGNLSHPILNALTFPQTVIAEVAFVMSGVDEAVAPHYSWLAAYGSNGRPVGAMGFLQPFTMMLKSMRDMARPSPELSRAFERMVQERGIGPLFVEGYIGENATRVKGLRQTYNDGDYVGWLHALSDFLPSNSEKLARAHSFTVGWNLAKDILRIEDFDRAYLFAKQFTEKTMYLYSTADRPRIFTTPAGSALGLFKTWVFNYMASMAEYSRLASRNPTNLHAWAPLLWQTAGAATMGGFAATPLYWIADGFARGFADKSLMQTTYDMFEGGWEADAIMFGLPPILSDGHISLYSNVQSPASNPLRDANMLFSVASIDRAMYLGRAMGQAFEHWQATGEHPARSPDVKNLLVKALAPATWQRAMSAWMDGDRITSLGTGYPLITEVPVGERIAYSLGFNPLQLDKAMAVSDELYRSQAKRRERTTALGRAYFSAMQARDGEQMQVILQQAMTWGLNPSTVLRSAMTRARGAEEPQAERAFRPQDVYEKRNILGR